MTTEIIDAKNRTLTSEELKRIKNTILSGGLVVFPTETVYGLGADATNANAALSVYKAKGRPSNNPLIIHISDPSEAKYYCETNETYEKLAKALMPGPLTVIMNKKDIIPLSVTGGLSTVAVRCPSHPLARDIIRACSRPIAAPSANLSGKPSPTCAKYCIEDLDGKVDIIIDGGDSKIGLESTIVKPNDDGSISLLRPGAITVDDIHEATGAVVNIAKGVLEELSAGTQPLSPGMMYRHYAPKTGFALLDGSSSLIYDYVNRQSGSSNVVFLSLDKDEGHFSDNVKLINIGNENDPLSQAARIFSALREADELHADMIYSRLPKTTGVELALFNRLIRASAHHIIKL